MISVRDGERKSREQMKMCWETQIRLALLSAGFMSPLSSTCHSVEGDNYRRLILAAYLERRWLK